MKDCDSAIFDSLTAHIAAVDSNGVIQRVNRAWRQFAAENATGNISGLMEGTHYFAACENTSGETGRGTAMAALKGIRQVLDGHRERFELAYPCHSPDVQRWFLMRVTPLEGDRNGAVIVHEDITAQKTAMDRLRHSEEVAGALIDAYPDSAALLDADGTVRDISQKTTRSLNTTRHAIIGKKIYDFLPPDLAASRRKRMERVASTGQTERFRDVRSGRVLDNTVYPIGHDKGPVTHLVIYAKDVTEQVQAETALKNKVEELRTILDALPQMVAYTDRDLVYRFVNGTYRDVFQRNADEIIGRRVPDLIGADAWKKTRGYVERALAGERVSFDETFHYPGQAPRQIHGELIPDMAPSGMVCGYYAILSDVSEIERSLAMAQTREKELAALLRASRAIYEEATFDRIARRIFDICRETIGARSGYVAMLSEDGSENELLFLEAGGLPCNVDPDLPMPIRGLRQEAYRSGRPVFDNDFHHSDWMDFMPAGHVRLDNVMFAPLIVDGRAVGLIGIANKPAPFTENDTRLAGAFADLTAVAFRRIQDDLAVRESESRYRSLFESASDALFVADPATGILVDANQRAEELLGRPRSAIIGLHQTEIHPPRAHASYENKFKAATKNQGQIFTEVEVVHSSGRRIPVEISSGGTILIGGQPLHFGLFRDITERKRAEEARRQSETELRFLTARLLSAQENERRRISAELHDDLGQALMVLKLQLRGAVNGLQTGRATVTGDLESALESINHIAEKLRLMARELSPSVLENFGLVPALQWLADQYAPHLDVVFDAAGVQTDGLLTREAATAIFRICQEAMTNVIRHAEAKSVILRMQKRADVLIVWIQDNGQGFDLQKAGPVAARTGGIGLLSIFERARLLDARINIRSEPGNGTTLRLEVPLEQPEKTESRKTIVHGEELP